MKPPIEALMTEHRFIEKLLDALAGFARRLRAEGAPREDLAGFVTFFREFADACHHGKEEDILFQAMIEHGVPRDGGPLAVMLQEHDLGRAEVRALAEVADGEGSFTDAEVKTVTDAAAAFSDLLRNHIMKEDQILYPMAEQVLPDAVWSDIAAGFERFEEQETGAGVHERLHGVGEELIRKYGAGG